MVFQMVYVDVPQRAANSGFTGQPSAVWLEGGEQQRSMAVDPIGKSGGAPLLAAHGTGNDAKHYRPGMAFATGVARVGHSGQGVEQTALLAMVHRGAPCNVWLRTRIPDDGPLTLTEP
jgi:hypothetical protein